jgi:hypothetical protein
MSRGAGYVDVHVHPTRFSAAGDAFAKQNRLDFSVKGLLTEMDANGVAQALFMAPRLAPSLKEGLDEGTQVHRETKGRLLLTSTVDPTRGEGEVQAALQTWDGLPEPIRAIKLYPGYQHFIIADASVEPVLSWAESHKVPVFIHQGDTADPKALVRYSRPIFLDEVAVRWPNVRFVLCHLGNPWIDEGCEVIYKNANVWGDTSGLLTPFAKYFDALKELMRQRMQQALALVGDPRKFLYGSDWPIVRIDDAMALITGLDISNEDKELILGANAREVLGLKEP